MEKFNKMINDNLDMKESIAERVKTRRQNKETDRDTQRTFAPSSPLNKDYSAETDVFKIYGRTRKRS